VYTEWSYEKNPEYWDVENVKLETINVSVVKESSTGLNLFQDGQLDDVILTGELAQQNTNSPEFVTLKESRTSYIEMNQREKDSPFNNENLRKALSYSIDREALVKQVLGDGSEASTGLIPQNMSFNPDTGKDFVEETTNNTEYDVEKAKEYWEKAKQELGIDSLSFELLSDDTDSVKKAAEYVQGVWNETLDGIDVSMTNVPFSVRLDRSNAGDFEVVFGGWGADYADPSSFTDLFVTGNAYNRGRWSNEDYDKAVKDAATTYATQPAERWQALLDAENILIEDMGTIPVYQRAEAHLRAEKVKNIVSHGAGASHDYKWAYIEE
jgi:oligopeptide transport system substrate-binding protein